jgi:phosphatidate cytidylyltransferase
LGAAIAVGLPLVILIVLALVYWPPGLIVMLVLVTSLACIELHDALKRVGMTSAKTPLVVGNIAIIGGSYAAGYFQPYITVPWHVVLLGCLGVTVLLALIWRMFSGAEGYARDAAASLFTIAYIPLLASFIGLILVMDGGELKLTTVFLAVVASDTGGYALGATIGKHQLAPNISPKKTWEGLVGSIVTSIATVLVMCFCFTHWPWWYGVIVALVAVVAGTAGDLVESLIKRDVGIKDMSSILPGHGGVMDRLDSVLFAAPACWFLLNLPMPA